MAGLVPAIHFPEAMQVTPDSGKWMAATRAAMTADVLLARTKT
jgi:hypothetical protein